MTLSPFQLIIGVDEAGRGPLAGPVTAAAVILHPQRPIEGLEDSKKLPEKRRDELALLIRERALCWAVAHAEVTEIDSINILQAALHIQVDGNRLPRCDDLPFTCTAEAIVDGDALMPAISAASILAKTARDALMLQLDQRYPGYGLAMHKGYGTPAHLQALQRLGPSPVHRSSFAPVRNLIEGYGAFQESDALFLSDSDM